MKKELFILFILFIPFCHSIYDVILYDGWAMSGKNINLSNQIFKIIYVKDSNSTVIYFPEGFSTVIHPGNNTCSKEWIYSVCQYNQKFEKNGIELIPSINERNINVSLYMQINSSNMSLSFEKQIQEISYMGDKFLVKTLIKKKGTSQLYDVTNISYTDSMSDNYDIEIIKGCEIKKNNIVWKSETMYSEHECIYYLTPKKEQNFTNKVYLSYDVFGKKQEKIFSYDLETIDLPFEYVIKENKNIRKIGEKQNFSILIMPLVNFTFEKIEFLMPDSFSLLNIPEENVLLNQSVEKEFIYFINNTHGGNFTILFNLVYSNNGKLYKIVKNISFEYIDTPFNVYLFTKDNSSRVRLNNPSEEYYKDINVEIGNTTYQLDYLGPKKFYDFDIPLTNSTYINYSYLTKYDQLRKKTLSLSKSAEPTATKDKSTIKFSKIGMNFEYIAITLGVVVLCFIIFKVLSGLRHKKSNLDKEIEKIRKNNL